MDSAKTKSIIYKTIIILFSAVLLYFGVALYLIQEYFFAAGFALVSVINIVGAIRKKSSDLTFWVVVGIGVNIGLTLYGSRRTFAKHEEYVCSARFGREFNGKREYRSVPILPWGWKKIDSGWRTVWNGDTSAFGHYAKEIIIDSACRIDWEDDDYKLKPVGDMAREISIRMKYAKGRGEDSLFYYYSVGDSTHAITRQKADSLFAAEHIESDIE